MRDLTASGAAVEVRDLVKAYARAGSPDRVAIDRADLTVSPGEGVALVGPNGAGKSTLILLMAGMRRPSAGTVRVFGDDPALPATRRRLGLLPDRPALYGDLTARDHLKLVAATHGLANPEARLADVLGRLDLGPAGTGPVGRLSAGIQKRLALALALLPGPDLLLLDEPLATLDPESARIVAEVLAEERARGVTLVVATHRLLDLAGCVDRVVQVLDGSVQRLGTLEHVLVRLPVRVVYALPPGAADLTIGALEASTPGLSIRVAPAARRDALVEQVRERGGAVLRVSPMLDVLATALPADLEETLA